MGGYGYNQSSSTPQLQGVNHSDGSNAGNAAEVGKIAGVGEEIGSQLGANAAAQAGYEATTAGLEGAAATGASTAAGSAAAAGAAGAGAGAVAGGATAGAMGSEALLALLFYGGESVSQIKSNKFHQVKVSGGSDGLRTNEDKTFYKNVHIPRKKV